MPYKERLYPWVLVRLLPKMQRLTVGQFRNRSDADGHLEILRRLVPSGKFAVIFNRYIKPTQSYPILENIGLGASFTSCFNLVVSALTSPQAIPA